MSAPVTDYIDKTERAVGDWQVRTIDVESKQPALRETNTMPQWAGSCWYFSPLSLTPQCPTNNPFTLFSELVRCSDMHTWCFRVSQPKHLDWLPAKTFPQKSLSNFWEKYMQNLTTQYVAINKHSFPFLNAISSVMYPKGRQCWQLLLLKENCFLWPGITWGSWIQGTRML